MQDGLEEPPLQIAYGPVHSFPGIPGVVLLIEPADTIRELVGNLESSATFRDAKQRSYRFTPHMTIAEYISMEETEQLVDELKDKVVSGRFLCSKLSYAVPDENFHFTERKCLEFAS